MVRTVLIGIRVPACGARRFAEQSIAERDSRRRVYVRQLSCPPENERPRFRGRAGEQRGLAMRSPDASTLPTFTNFRCFSEMTGERCSPEITLAEIDRL
jgi:hypothetical protein